MLSSLNKKNHVLPDDKSIHTNNISPLNGRIYLRGLAPFWFNF